MKRGTLTKEVVLNEAMTIVSNDGLEHLTYNGLARSLGVQPQSLYRYVANITEVKTGVIGTYMHGLSQTMYQELLPYSGKEALRQLANRFVAYTQTGIGFTDMVSGLVTYREAPEVIDTVGEMHDLVTTLIASVTSDESQVEANVHLYLNFVIGSLTYLTVRHADQDAIQQEFEANVERILSVMN